MLQAGKILKNGVMPQTPATVQADAMLESMVQGGARLQAKAKTMLQAGRIL